MMSVIITVILSVSLIFAVAGGNTEKLCSSFLEDCGSAVELAISICGIICLWSGIMRVAQSSGLTEKLARIFSPVLSLLFGGLKREGAAMQFITLNITANLLGLGNASTPFGLSAMREIEKEERSADTSRASHNMIVFTVLNTASLQIIPAAAAALRLQHGSAAPMEILPCVWISSAASLAAALIAARIMKSVYERRGL